MRFTLAILLAFIGAYWVHNDAKSRGISAFPWALLTFLALIIGLPLYLLLRPRGELVECMWCNKKKLYSLSPCPHCGNSSRKQAEKVPNNVQTGTVHAQKGVCISCGKILDSTWEYCPYCGSEQKERLH